MRVVTPEMKMGPKVQAIKEMKMGPKVQAIKN